MSYLSLTTAEHVAALEAVGLDAGHRRLRRGHRRRDPATACSRDADGTLSRLIGRPTTPLVEGLRAAVPAQEQSAA